MFANVPDPLDLLKGCCSIMDDKSILSIETGYHPRQLENNMIDYIYNEQFFSFSVKGFIN